MRHFRLFTVAALIVCGFVSTTGFAAKTAARPPYKGFIAIDAASGKVLAEESADVVSPPASMTKLMTFAVLHDKLASGAITLGTQVTVTALDSSMGGTQVYLKEGETFTVEELIYAMMIQSANDAAHALGRTAAGSAQAFAELMNEKAKQIGMTHSTFRSPHGLPPANRRAAEGDLTTPRDYAVLSRYLLTETDVTKYTSIRSRKFGEGKRTADTVTAMVNHNKLINRVAGVDGLKTGFTQAAGFCIAATAQRDGRRVIAVVMGSPDAKTRDLKTIDLIERGFAAIPAGSVMPTSQTKALPAAQPEEIPVVKTDQPAAKEQASTGAEPMFKLNLPSQKK
ncbi:D-alanyl-D-alanine carboxypeptidase family protein [Oleiharenicola lentus]|uniref:D-alanyl-D-alanine carboxypeptidase family protein n=1 Tax=Oleiharenicola lentus TaxID=2508720 RepID=UPI003F681BD1